VGELGGFGADESVGAREVTMTLFAIVCFSALTLMALTEQFGSLPSAVAAFCSAWCILRL
jgi:hypothetical protein